MRRVQSAYQEAETWLRRGAQAGNASAMRYFAALLTGAGRPEEAEQWLGRAADAGWEPER